MHRLTAAIIGQSLNPPERAAAARPLSGFS